MTKRLFFMAFAFATLLISGCNKYDIDDDDPEYSDVYEGIVIYNEAVVTRVLASDGVSIALRLAILLKEYEDARLTFEGGVEPEWSGDGSSFTFPYDGSSYDKREFLFGSRSGVTITQSGDVYTILFGKEDYLTHYSAKYDMLMRKCGYVVNTYGQSLTDAGDEWRVDLVDVNGDENSVEDTVTGTYATKSAY